MKKYIIGNWKMNKLFSEAQVDFQTLLEGFRKLSGSEDLEIGVAAVGLHLQGLARNQGLKVYSQNVYHEDFGAFTGEWSVPMLSAIGVSGSLVGHSERRQHFLQSNEQIGKATGRLLSAKLRTILCIGETLEQRNSGRWREVLREQLVLAFRFGSITSTTEIFASEGRDPLLLIAYEPVWAIGTGLAATVSQADEAHQFIRTELGQMLSVPIATSIPLLYGGSVSDKNIREYLSTANINGALVGGASLKPESYLNLVTQVLR